MYHIINLANQIQQLIGVLSRNNFSEDFQKIIELRNSANNVGVLFLAFHLKEQSNLINYSVSFGHWNKMEFF